MLKNKYIPKGINLGWISYKNYAKEKRPTSWINSRWIWFIGDGNKDISLQVTSRPSFGWGFEVDGCEGDVSFRFWFILKFYLTFSRVFPEWVYPKEYNQFADEENKKRMREAEASGDGCQKYSYAIPTENRNLKGRDRTKEKGWIRTANREIELSFHHYSMWWRIWTNPNEWQNGIPKWRHGSFDFVRLLKGKDKVEREVVFEGNDEIDMPEGKYKCKIDYTKFTRRYSRWWPKVWHRFQLEFGYEDENGEFIMTPVPHWGKGENSWDCGMDGTHSISLGSGIKTLEEAKKSVVESCLKSRERYGSVDFSNVTGIENGYVTTNLIGQF